MMKPATGSQKQARPRLRKSVVAGWKRWWTTWLATACAGSVAGWGLVVYARWFFPWSDTPGRYAEGMIFLSVHTCLVALELACLGTAALDFDRRRFGRWDASLLAVALSHLAYVVALILPAMLG